MVSRVVAAVVVVVGVVAVGWESWWCLATGDVELGGGSAGGQGSTADVASAASSLRLWGQETTSFHQPSKGS